MLRTLRLGCKEFGVFSALDGREVPLFVSSPPSTWLPRVVPDACGVVMAELSDISWTELDDVDS